MPWDLHYTPDIWPSLFSTAFFAALGVTSWRQRGVPGARQLAVMLFMSSLWGLGTSLATASTTEGAAILWTEFAYAWLLPMAAARLGFVLEYTDPGRWLTRPLVALFVVASTLPALLLLTSGLHQLVRFEVSANGVVNASTGVVAWIFTAWAYLLALIGLILLARLFIRSPRHRLPVTMVMLAQLTAHVGFAIDRFASDLAFSMDMTVAAAMISGGLYALALYRERLFDPIPIARETVIEQMAEGMLVFDSGLRLVDLNRAAEAVLALPRSRALGSTLASILPPTTGLPADLPEFGDGGREVILGAGKDARVYELRTSPLQDHRGAPLGTLALMHDVTDRKRAQAQILEQQRLVAVLLERQNLARELHDGVAQVLNYAGLQARAIQKWIALGDLATAQEQSQRLARVAEDAHADVRASIRDLKFGSATGWSLLEALERHVASFTASTGIAAELAVPPNLEQDPCRTDAGLQVLRVIQEALTNVRKHSSATSVRVSLDCGADAMEITVTDNGRGFDPTEGGPGGDGHFGLGTMRERMLQIGGTIDIRSQSGAGTQVCLKLPRQTHASGEGL